MDNRLDLAPFQKRQRLLSERETATKAEVLKAQRELAECWTKSKHEISSLIAQGMSTGNPLHDECLREFGLDEKRIANLLAFNQKLVGAKGKKCVLTFTWRQRLSFHLMDPDAGRDASKEDFVTRTGYIVGVLSGERMVFISVNPFGFQIELPFKKYTIFNLNTETDCDLRIGKCTISTTTSLFKDSLASDLVALINGEESICSIAFEGEEEFVLDRWVRVILDSPTSESDLNSHT